MSIELAIYTWPLSGKGIFLRNVLKLSDPRKTELKIPKGDGGYALPLSSPPSNAYCQPPCLLFSQLCQCIRKIKLDWIMWLCLKKKKPTNKSDRAYWKVYSNLLIEERI